MFTVLATLSVNGQIEGCTNTVACNYDPTATFDNGTCEFINDGVIDILNTTFTYDIDCNGEQWSVVVTFPEPNFVVYDGATQTAMWSLCGSVLNINDLTSVWDGDSFYYTDDAACSGDFIPEVVIGVEEPVATAKKLVKVINTMGQEIDPMNASESNKMLIYIYDDGSIVKKVRI